MIKKWLFPNVWLIDIYIWHYDWIYILNPLFIAAELDHRDNDCFTCAILSHGEDGFIWGIDRMIPINDLMEPFKGNKCLSLAGKPKIFFIQVITSACP